MFVVEMDPNRHIIIPCMQLYLDVLFKDGV